MKKRESNLEDFKQQLATETVCTQCFRPLPPIVGGVWRSSFPRPTACLGGCKAVRCVTCKEPLSVKNAPPSVLAAGRGRCRKCDGVYQKTSGRRAYIKTYQRDRYWMSKDRAIRGLEPQSPTRTRASTEHLDQASSGAPCAASSPTSASS